MILQIFGGWHGLGVGSGFGGGHTLLLLLTCQCGAISGQDDTTVPFGKRQSSVWLLSHVPKKTKEKL